MERRQLRSENGTGRLVICIIAGDSCCTITYVELVPGTVLVGTRLPVPVESVQVRTLPLHHVRKYKNRLQHKPQSPILLYLLTWSLLRDSWHNTTYERSQVSFLRVTMFFTSAHRLKTYHTVSSSFRVPPADLLLRATWSLLSPLSLPCSPT